MTQQTETALSREVMSRIRRRVNLLARVNYERYVAALVADVRTGAVSADGIERWLPAELRKA